MSNGLRQRARVWSRGGGHHAALREKQVRASIVCYALRFDFVDEYGHFIGALVHRPCRGIWRLDFSLVSGLEVMF